MQRLVVVTFRERNAATATGGEDSAARHETSVRRTQSSAPLVLPPPATAQRTEPKQLTRVERTPVFLPPPAPESALRAPRIDSDITFVVNEISPSRFPKVLRAAHQTDDGSYEICKQNHGKDAAAEHGLKESETGEQNSSLINWFRRGRREPSESPSEVNNADFSADVPQPQKSTSSTKSRKHDRRYVKKPGNRRPVR